MTLSSARDLAAGECSRSPPMSVVLRGVIDALDASGEVECAEIQAGRRALRCSPPMAGHVDVVAAVAGREARSSRAPSTRPSAREVVLEVVLREVVGSWVARVVVARGRGGRTTSSQRGRLARASRRGRRRDAVREIVSARVRRRGRRTHSNAPICSGKACRPGARIACTTVSLAEKRSRAPAIDEVLAARVVALAV